MLAQFIPYKYVQTYTYAKVITRYFPRVERDSGEVIDRDHMFHLNNQMTSPPLTSLRVLEFAGLAPRYVSGFP